MNGISNLEGAIHFLLVSFTVNSLRARKEVKWTSSVSSERGCPVVKPRYGSVRQVWVRKLEISLPGLLGDSKKDRKLLVCYKTIEEIKNGWRGRKALQYMLLLLLK